MRMVVDLHGYPVWKAIQVATRKIRQAWETGCGRPASSSRAAATATGSLTYKEET
jgi:hypothetical protein